MVDWEAGSTTVSKIINVEVASDPTVLTMLTDLQIKIATRINSHR